MAETAGERRSLKLARDRPLACPSATSGLLRVRVSQSPTSGALSVNGGSVADEVPEARFASRREQPSLGKDRRWISGVSDVRPCSERPVWRKCSPGIRPGTLGAPPTISRNCGAKEWFARSGPRAAMSQNRRSAGDDRAGGSSRKGRQAVACRQPTARVTDQTEPSHTGRSPLRTSSGRHAGPVYGLGDGRIASTILFSSLLISN